MPHDGKTVEISAGGQAVGYVRVSSAEQAESGLSLPAQRARIEAYCASHGLAMAAVHADEGISGRKASNRPGLEAALAQVCSIKGTLVVPALSRLARSTIDAILIAQRLQRAGCQLVMLSESIDTRTASGQMLYEVMAALAALESRLIGERTRSVLQYKRARGERYCNKAPYGYSFVGGRIEPRADEQAVISQIATMRAGGQTCRDIARTLSELGVRNRVGRPFPHQHVSRIARASGRLLWKAQPTEPSPQ